MNVLFTEHLRHSSFATKPFAEADEEANSEVNEFIFEALTAFAWALDDDMLAEESEYDLEDLSDQWAAFEELTDEETISVLKGCLAETAAQAFGSPDDESIRGVLRILKTAPKATATTATVLGPTPRGTKAFLQQLKVLKYGDSYGNDDVYAAKAVKQFPKDKFRYGHPYSDYNSQKPTQIALKNPTLSVHTEAFRAVDAVGQGFTHQWRIYNVLSNEWVSPLMLKSEAEAATAELNQMYVQELHEAANGQQAIPTTHLQENLSVRDENRMNRYLEALNRQNFTMSGSIAQSGGGSTMISDMKAAAQLINERKARFGEDENVRDELGAIHAYQKMKR